MEPNPAENQNIEEYKLLEQEVFELEDYIRDFWEFIPVPIAYLNPSGIIMDVDRAMEKLLGVPREDLIGTKMTEHIKTEGLSEQIHEETMAQGGVKDREALIASGSDRDIPVTVSSTVRHSHENEIVGYFLAFADTSGLKKMQTDLKKKLEELKEFHDLAVGRELKMIELEKEVNTLLVELGRKAKYTV